MPARSATARCVTPASSRNRRRSVASRWRVAAAARSDSICSRVRAMRRVNTSALRWRLSRPSRPLHRAWRRGRLCTPSRLVGCACRLAIVRAAHRVGVRSPYRCLGRTSLSAPSRSQTSRGAAGPRHRPRPCVARTTQRQRLRTMHPTHRVNISNPRAALRGDVGDGAADGAVGRVGKGRVPAPIASATPA